MKGNFVLCTACYCFLFLCHLSQHCRLRGDWASISKRPICMRLSGGEKGATALDPPMTKSFGFTKLYRNWYSAPPPQIKYQSPVLPKLHLWLTSTHIIASECETNSVNRRLFSTCISFNILSDLNDMLWAFIHHQPSIHKAMNWGVDIT